MSPTKGSYPGVGDTHPVQDNTNWSSTLPPPPPPGATVEQVLQAYGGTPAPSKPVAATSAGAYPSIPGVEAVGAPQGGYPYQPSAPPLPTEHTTAPSGAYPSVPQMPAVPAAASVPSGGYPFGPPAQGPPYTTPQTLPPPAVLPQGGSVPEADVAVPFERQIGKIIAFLKGFFVSITVFVEACQEPGIKAAMQKSTKGVAIATSIQYAFMWMLMLPMKLLSFLLEIVTFGSFDSDALEAFCNDSLAACYRGNPFVNMLLSHVLLKKTLRTFLYQSLTRVSPDVARELQETPKLWSRFRTLSRLTDAPDALEGIAVPTVLTSVVRATRAVPVLGDWAAPFAQYATLSNRMNKRVCAALCLVSLVPLLAHWGTFLVEVWLAANAMGEDVLNHFITRTVHQSRRTEFARTYEHLIVGYLFVPALLMKVPVAGVVSYIPAHAVAAQLLLHILGGRTVAQFRSEWSVPAAGAAEDKAGKAH